MLHYFLATLCGACLVGAFAGLTQQQLKDQVTSLPGQPSVTFQQFAGYIDLPQTNKSIFYYFQTTDSAVTNAPVFLWTNGGPGCSGLLGGFIEQGAFRIQQNGSLLLNPGRWNQRVNMLFIEQPAGVGYSYSTNPSDYTTGDSQAVADMYSFILSWLKAFPDYAANDFYISSESYGGHYMPLLAKYIVQHNTNNTIKFKGFLVGNPYTDPVENTKGMYDTFFGHSLVSLPAWKQYYSVCKDGVNYNDANCQTQMNNLENQVGNIYLYGLDWPVCNDGQSLYGFKQQQWFIEKVLKPMGRGHGFPRSLKSHHKVLSEQELGDLYEPCQTDYLTTYLNRQDVQTALHAKSGTVWSMCSNNVVWNGTDFEVYMEPVYQFLINGGYNLHITVYSGDDDSVCGTLGTQSWLWNLGYSPVGNWVSWSQDEEDNGPQVAGFFIRFSYNSKVALNFVTVHSAGHQVPWFNAQRGYLVLDGYLDGRW